MTNTEPPIPSREPTYPTSGGLPIAPAVPLVTGYTPAELEALAGGRLVPAPLLDDRKVHIAYILLIFLGLLGVHKFYLGSIVWGIVYFFTLGLFGIGVIVDIFTLNSKQSAPNSIVVGPPHGRVSSNPGVASLLRSHSFYLSCSDITERFGCGWVRRQSQPNRAAISIGRTAASTG